ncbi:OmpA family protein [Crossiella cryophila]|uniref:OmpA-like domain-containing protein n=1 Tax=Crossiella cryophila TaxID=43355 RepID=A0A7W7FVW3_9PSEU|nr:hypothetical protein [Crossiella cryophila]MBB4678953.1 hypothetical protein [Crossiella cryophila]
MDQTAADPPPHQPRPQWIGWTLTAVTVPALLAGLGVAVAGPRIERELVTTAEDALGGAGHPDAQVAAVGRELSLAGLPGERLAAVSTMVANLPGVDSVVVRELAPTPVLLRVRDGELLVSATGHSVLATGRLLEEIIARCPGHRVTDLTLPVPGTGPAFASTALAAVAQAAAEARGADLTVAIRPDGVTVRGVVADADQRNVLLERLRGSEFGPVQAGGLTVGPPPHPSTVDIRALDAAVGRMIDGSGGVNFEAATVRWGEGHGAALLERIGRLLRVAPKSLITVTAWASEEQPPGVDPRRLAGRRADLVRDLLVAQGVPRELVSTVARVEPGPETFVPHLRRARVTVS